MLADRFRTAIETGGAPDALAALYASDALLDANVPVWRFQRKGLEEITAQFVDWYAADGSQIEDLHEWVADWGSVIETVDRGSTDGEPTYSRTLHLLLVEDGKVTRHIMYCTGRWDAATEARQRVEAPMVER